MRSPLVGPSPQFQATMPTVSNGYMPERVPTPPTPATSVLSRPMAASATRDSLAASNVTPDATGLPNFNDLRSSLYRDLMSQMKADLERGG